MTIPGPGGDLTIRVYHPFGAAANGGRPVQGALPVLIWIHACLCRCPGRRDGPTYQLARAEQQPTRGPAPCFAGVPVTASRYDGMMHEFFSAAAILDKAEQAQHEAADLLKASFGGIGSPMALSN